MADDEIDYVNAPGWQTVSSATAQNGASVGNPNFDFRTAEQRSEDIRLLAKSSEDTRRAEEAKLEAVKLKSGVAIPRPMVPMDAITMEVAMSSDTATVALRYLVDPFLPSGCVVGFFGRGSTAKSSFVATLGAQISGEASTLWVSVEEPNDWIRVRHIKIGGDEGTLFVTTAVANKADPQGRVTGSSFDVYEHLETAIQKAKRTPLAPEPSTLTPRNDIENFGSAGAPWAMGGGASGGGRAGLRVGGKILTRWRPWRRACQPGPRPCA